MPDTTAAKALMVELSARERFMEQRRDDLIGHFVSAPDLVDALERDRDQIRCDLDRLLPGQAVTARHA